MPGYRLTTDQADEIIRMLGYDDQADEDAEWDGMHIYYLEDGTVIEIGLDGKIEHQQLIEKDGGLEPENIGDVTSVGVDYGVVEYFRCGIHKGYMDFAVVEKLTPEERREHDLQVLDQVHKDLEQLAPDAVKRGYI